MNYANYHTHTCFCDGKDTPRRMVEEAIRLGCREIGFSGHSYTDFESGWCMSREATKAYRKELLALREEFCDRIRILIGIEQEFYAGKPTEQYDYVIGSVHYTCKNGTYLSVDKSAECQIEVVRQYYDGDFYAFAEDYYDNVARVYDITGCNIVGHFDLITKFNEGNCLFDTRHPRYCAAVEKAIRALSSAPVYIEINTGAISRGYRTEFYPELPVLSAFANVGKKFILASDCHCAGHLLFGFEDAAKAAKKVLKGRENLILPYLFF